MNPSKAMGLAEAKRLVDEILPYGEGFSTTKRIALIRLIRNVSMEYHYLGAASILSKYEHILLERSKDNVIRLRGYIDATGKPIK